MVIFNALRAGKILISPARWKNSAILANAILAIITLISYILEAKGTKLPFDNDQLQYIAQWLAEGMLGVNIYIHAATSKKVGL